MRDSLFADQEARAKAILHKIIYAKTLPYKLRANIGWLFRQARKAIGKHGHITRRKLQNFT